MNLLKLLLLVLPIVLSIGGWQYSNAFSDITLTEPIMVDTMGEQVSTFHVGQQIGVESTLTNNGDSEQKFTYLVQVLDENGGTEYLEGFSASMLSKQSFTASQVWIPKHSGQYTIQVFVWDSLSSAIPLTSVLQTQIIVD